MRVKTCLAVMYHHVRDSDHPFPWVKGISDKDFIRQIQKIEREYTIISLKRYAQYLYGERDIPDRAALLTFDDGLEDHYRVVFPILKRMGLVASFFPVSECVKERKLTPAHKNHFLMQSLPIEELRSLVYARIPEKFRTIERAKRHRVEAKKRYRFDASEIASFKYFLNHKVPQSVRSSAIAKVFKAQFPREDEIAEKFYLGEAHIRTMAKAGFEFGSHSHTHVVLSHLSKIQQERELRTSQRYLASLTGTPITMLSYPFGHIGEFNRTTIDVAKKLGFRVGLANIKKINRGKVDPFSIARMDTVFLK